MHVGGHLRESFENWVMDGGMEGKPEIDEAPVEIEWLLGQLLHCSDIMPGMLCSDLEMRVGSTYARAARRLLAALKRGERLSSSVTSDEV
jgi:hypothetical protein